MATFTTWAAAKQQALDDMVSKNFMTKSYSVNNHSTTCRDLKELQDFVKFCDLKIAEEETTTGRRILRPRFRRPC